HEAGGHREGLAFRVVVGDEPHRDASPGADRDHVDALERRPPEAVEQRSRHEPVLHHHEPAGRELAFQHFPDLLVRRRSGEPRERKAANTWAQSAPAKQATARMPPSQPSSSAAYKSEPEPAKTDHRGTASRYAARFFASPDESLTPMMLVCAASCRSRPAAMGRCVYLGML